MTWTEPAFDAVARLVGARTGLVFIPERRVSVEQGIRRAMSRAGMNDPSIYMAKIVNNPALLEDLIGELTIGETYFFREPGHFEFVRQVALPRLLEARGPSHTIRTWSAGCSSGEEAYSLALLFKDVGLAGRTKIVATDISPVALAKARRGVYGAWSFRGDAADMARNHLDRQGNDYVIPESLRGKVSFSTLNLASEDYPSFTVGVYGMDLIFCRNVLIYFDRPMIRQVANRLYASLAEGGWLLTASSDPPLGGEAPFETVLTDYGVFYRRGPAAVGAVKPKVSPFEGSVDLRLSSESVATPVRDPARISPSFAAGPTIPTGSRNGPAPSPTTPSRPKAEELIPRPKADDPLEEARRDLARGDYAKVIEKTRGLTDEADACSLYIRALANVDVPGAGEASAKAIARHPFSCELNLLRSAILSELGRDEEACGAARRVVYLDRTLAIGHFFLGALLRRRGDVAGAKRAFRNARDLCASRPADEVVPLSDGEPAGRLAEAARDQLESLGGEVEGAR